MTDQFDTLETNAAAAVPPPEITRHYLPTITAWESTVYPGTWNLRIAYEAADGCSDVNTRTRLTVEQVAQTIAQELASE